MPSTLICTPASAPPRPRERAPRRRAAREPACLSAALPLLLRLRGGADIPDGTGTGTGLRLSREEITAKLNRVPTFCIMQGDGSVISLPDPAGAEGDECCTWFTDAAEAQYTFKRVCAANPELVDEGLRLQTHGLGDVFAMCDGWPREEGEATTEVSAQDQRAVRPPEAGWSRSSSTR